MMSSDKRKNVFNRKRHFARLAVAGGLIMLVIALRVTLREIMLGTMFTAISSKMDALLVSMLCLGAVGMVTLNWGLSTLSGAKKKHEMEDPVSVNERLLDEYLSQRSGNSQESSAEETLKNKRL
jgi:hypothetical protein